jgi:large subunit ribosomal protein L30
MSKIAVILIRGTIGLSHELKKTLTMLRLKRKNNCVVIDDKPSLVGMVKRVKDYATWGEADKETLAILEKKMRNGTAHLHPPRKGYGRKGVKVQFTVGGALGDRGEKINDLIKRMV